MMNQISALLPNTALGWEFIVDNHPAFTVQSDGREINETVSNERIFRMAVKLETAIVPAIKDFMAWKFASIPQVSKVYVDQAHKVLYIRIVVPDDRNKGIRDRIHLKELEVIREFEMFDFDFYIESGEYDFDDPTRLIFKRA